MRSGDFETVAWFWWCSKPSPPLQIADFGSWPAAVQRIANIAILRIVLIAFLIV